MLNKFSIIPLLTILSCKNEIRLSPKTEIQETTKTAALTTVAQPQKVKATDYIFFSDSILHGHRDILKYYFAKCNPDTCPTLEYDKAALLKNFEGLLSLGDINGNNIKDSVFILDPLSYCKLKNETYFDGQAYYFTDTSLPRLQTDSYCCHPSSIFLVGDIDEDGISEIGQYFSSCASRYKSLYVYSLKNERWEQIGHSVYDLMYVDTKKPFNDFVKKIGKNKFKMLEITDLTRDKSKMGKPNWKFFSM